MTQHIPLDPGQKAIEPFFDDIQEQLGASAPSFYLTVLNGTTLRAPAGTDNDQSTVAINGKYRRNVANVDAAHPGGAAGTYDVYVTGSDNAFTAGSPTINTTNYAFGLQIVAAGSPPGTALKRKVGEVDWDGSKITAVRQLVGMRRDGAPVCAIAPIAGLSALRVVGAASQSAPLADFRNNAGTQVASVGADGAIVSAASVTAQGTGGLVASGNGGKTTLNLSNTTVNVGLTIGGDVTFYRSAAGQGKMDAPLEIAGGGGSKTALTISPTNLQTGLTVGNGAGAVNWYRNAADQWGTDDSVAIAGDLDVAGNLRKGGTAVLTAVSQLSSIATDLGAVTAGTFTGGTTRTSGTAGSSGAGLVYDSAGLRGYNTTPNGTFEVKASNGLVVVGALSGDTTVQRIEADRTSVRFYGNGDTDPSLMWSTIAVADPPGTGGTTGRGQLTTSTDTSISRMWWDSKGLHSQIKIGAAAPFRTFDFDPNDPLGLRLHTSATTDAIRVDPVAGVTFKLAPNTGAPDLTARWVRPSGTGLSAVAARIWGDDFGDSTKHGALNLEARAVVSPASSGVSQWKIAAVNDVDSGIVAQITGTTNLGAGGSLIQAVASGPAGTPTQTTRILGADGTSGFVQLLSNSTKTRLASGNLLCTFNGSSVTSDSPTVSHGFGTTPGSVVVSARSGTALYIAAATAIGATTFAVTVRRLDGTNPPNGTQITVDWQATG